jgi:CDP-diacylglycerol--glycerol-3-phosphate 3-phosphatidyltransferase
LLRILAVPVIVILLLWPEPGPSTAATAVFLVAALTDFLDGQLARRAGAVTEFGKKLDPLADRLFISGTILALTVAGVLPLVGVILVVARDIFMIVGYKVAEARGARLRVSFFGKAYTAVLMVAIVLAMAGIEINGLQVGLWLFWAGVAGSLLSGVAYAIGVISQLRGMKVARQAD